MEKYLDMIIAVFGFEHPYTISVATMIETQVSEETIKATVEGLLEMQSL